MVLDAFPIDRPRLRPGSLEAYLVAMAVTAIATLLRVIPDPALTNLPFDGLPYASFFVAVIVTVFLAGSTAAFLTVILSIAAAWLFVLPPYLAPLAIYQTVMFGVGAATVIAVIGAMRAASAKVRRLNESLQISEARLAEASRAKSEFLARMSHELRTPLNAIIGFSEMIAEAMIGPLDVRYRSYGADIGAAGRHLQNIINDILDIAKIEGGRLELREESVSIAESVEACRRIVATMAAAAGVAVAVDLPAVLPPIRSDALRLRQILLHLLSNGVKFTPAGGHVRVSAAVVGDVVLIAVEDNGIGMRAEDIAVALEPFRQIDANQGGAFTRRFDGAGLGLPLAKSLVELQGGTLEIMSAPAVGTTVYIRLPVERRAAAA
jgi:signal transduction histidine kinase